MPRPPHASTLGAPGDITADGSQLGERGAEKAFPGTARSLPGKAKNHKKVEIPSSFSRTNTTVVRAAALLYCRCGLRIVALLLYCGGLVGGWVVGGVWVGSGCTARLVPGWWVEIPSRVQTKRIRLLLCVLLDCCSAWRLGCSEDGRVGRWVGRCVPGLCFRACGRWPCCRRVDGLVEGWVGSWVGGAFCTWVGAFILWNVDLLYFLVVCCSTYYCCAAFAMVVWMVVGRCLGWREGMMCGTWVGILVPVHRPALAYFGSTTSIPGKTRTEHYVNKPPRRCFVPPVIPGAAVCDE